MKAQRRNRRMCVVFPVFEGYEVRVLLVRDIAATGRRLQADLTNAAGASLTSKDCPLVGWVVLGIDPTPGHIAHEASHAIRAMFAYVGARTDNETFAFHLAYLVTRIHAFIERNK